MRRMTHCVVGVVETQAADEPNVVSRERSEELLDGEHGLGDLGGRIEGRADDFMCFDGLLAVVREAD